MSEYAQALETAAHLLCAASGFEKLGRHEEAVDLTTQARGLVAFAADVLAKEPRP